MFPAKIHSAIVPMLLRSLSGSYDDNTTSEVEVEACIKIKETVTVSAIASGADKRVQVRE
jgi:hypothetical protein